MSTGLPLVLRPIFLEKKGLAFCLAGVEAAAEPVPETLLKPPEPIWPNSKMSTSRKKKSRF
jgi:hypothetical protein